MKTTALSRAKSRLTYSNIIATLALFIALGGVSYAAVKLPKNSVTSKTIKKNAVTSEKIKRSAVTSAKIKNSTIVNSDIKDGTIGGSKLNLGALGTVPSATTAGTAADQYNLVRTATPSASNNDPAVARAAATEIPLVSNSQISIYAKCFVDADANNVLVEVYSRTSANGAIQYGYSIDDGLYGNPSLNTGTLETDRQIATEAQTADGVDYNYASGASVLGPDGKGLFFSAQIYVRSGLLADAPGLLSNPQSCLIHIAGSKAN
ncbi:MAG: hypothetical protein ACRDKE_12135 [Solirubrobacterales bacterium]